MANKSNEVLEENLEVKSEKKKEVNVSPEAYLNELVPYTAFYDGEKYKDPIFVAVNGKGFAIERGVEVWIPRYVKAILDNSAEQDKKTASYIHKASNEYASETKRLGY